MPAPGHVGNVNPKQEKALEAFRECLLNEQLISMENPPPYQETQLLRFLRARDSVSYTHLTLPTICSV